MFGPVGLTSGAVQLSGGEVEGGGQVDHQIFCEKLLHGADKTRAASGHCEDVK